MNLHRDFMSFFSKHSKIKSSQILPKGLVNKGNKCFFNAVSQCLFSLPIFIAHFQLTEVDAQKQPVSCALKHFIQKYRNSLSACDLITESSWTCDSCGVKGELSISYEIVSSSGYFIVHLSRFLDLHSKNRKAIEVDRQITLNGVEYKLVGVVCHIGDLGSGHYYSYALRNNEFYRFDNTYVEKVDELVLNPDEPYLLFYQVVLRNSQKSV